MERQKDFHVLLTCWDDGRGADKVVARFHLRDKVVARFHLHVTVSDLSDLSSKVSESLLYAARAMFQQ